MIGTTSSGWTIIRLSYREHDNPREERTHSPAVNQCPSLTRFLFQDGISTTRSFEPLGTHWQPSRDSRERSGASSSWSSSTSLGSLQASSPSFTFTWHVEQAATPPQACSKSRPLPSAISTMLPGNPVSPYGMWLGSTVTV